MHSASFLRPRALVWLTTLALMTVFIRQEAHAQIDAGINITVWKMLYGVTNTQASDPAWLVHDDDGDGVANGAELAAGTNPFDPASKVAVAATALDATTLSLTLPTVPGKVYIVQTSPNLADPAG